MFGSLFTKKSCATKKSGGLTPNLVRTKWTSGQHFTARDDPDRVRMEIKHPAFITKKDPKTQREAVEVKEVDLPWVTKIKEEWQKRQAIREAHEKGEAKEGADDLQGNQEEKGTKQQKQQKKKRSPPYDPKPCYHAVVVHNIFTPKECEELIKMTNAKGYTPALLNIGMGRQMFAPETRDGWRCIIDSESLTKYLFEVIKPHLPPTIMGRRLVELNERCRFLCYNTPGQMFDAHFDGRYTRPNGPRSGDSSRITIQLYLNDVPEADGGATTFLDNNTRVPCQPRAGSALLFSQNLYHEGTALNRGVKYTLRTEAMYESGNR